MARLKFLVFALVALALWAYHLTMIAPLALTGSVEQAQASVAGAAGPVAVALESRRSLTQAVALKVASNAAAWNVGLKGGKAEVPNAERLGAVRAAANELIPSDLSEQLFIALVNDAGALMAKGSAAPSSTAPEGFELAAAIDPAASAGAMRVLEGVTYFVIAVPLLVSDKNEVRPLGNAVIGLPLFPEAKVLEQTVKALGLKSLALIVDGKPAVVAGDKAGIAQILSGIKSGANGPLASGPVRELGPLELPMMADSTVQLVGGRQLIGGTPFEVAASAPARAALEALAAYQIFGFGSLAGLAMLAVVMMMVMGPETRAPSMVAPPLPLPPVSTRREDGAAKGPLKMKETEAPPEASPDDFHFPVNPTSIKSSVSLIDSADAFNEVEKGRAPVASTLEAPVFQPESDGGEGRTVAYPAYVPGQPPPPPPLPSSSMADPFASSDDHGGDNPDATRVASVPAELIRAARAAGLTSEHPAVKVSSGGGAMPQVASMAPPSEEERHFQDVFRDFVSTREKCREPADGLTFEKFKAKLLKNKEQLISKYQCRSVRFQVYVKDGKAALKATPIKD